MPLRTLSRRLLASGILSLPIIGGDLARDEHKFFQYAKKVLEERAAAADKEKEESGIQKDIMHYLLHATDPTTGESFTHEQLGAESSLLIAAGADTTSLTLAAAFFYLVRHPQVLRTLEEEIRSAFSSSESADLMTSSKLVTLPYLRAVIDETLRLAPPVPSLLPREVLEDGITIDGTFVPESTIVGVPAYAIHRNSEYFPEPEKFIPERWLATELNSSDVFDDSTPSTSTFDVPRTRQSVSLARQAFIAFSQGSRGCIGRQLAYYELHTALAHLLYRFEIRLSRDPQTQKPVKDSTDWREGLMDPVDPKGAEESQATQRLERQREDEFQLFDRFLADRNGPMVEFRERETSIRAHAEVPRDDKQ
jgi:cytochrome P450